MATLCDCLNEEELLVEFKRYLDNGYASSFLVQYVDSHLSFPNPTHLNLHQSIWLRDRAWCKCYDEHESIGEREVCADYFKCLRSDFHHFYFSKYLAGFLSDSERIGASSPELLDWVNGRFEEVGRMIDEGKIENKPWQCKLC